MTASRNTIYQALFALVGEAYPWASVPSRRLKLWDAVPLDQRPAIFQFEGVKDKYEYSSGTIFSSQKRTIHAHWYAYIDAKDPSIVGSIALNDIKDAFDAAITPDTTGKFTLGGLVDDCRIADVIFFEPGDLDGDGVLILDIEMVLP